MINVVVVDDEADVKVLFQYFLEEEIAAGKFNIFFKQSGKECLEQLSDLTGETVVLTDVKMPDMSGIELQHEISQNHPKVKIILMSAYLESECCSEKTRLTIDAYYSKPIDFNCLKSKIFSLAS